jgi:hypothetical protein
VLDLKTGREIDTGHITRIDHNNNKYPPLLHRYEAGTEEIFDLW